MRNAILLMLVMLFGLSASGFAAPVTTSNVFDPETMGMAKDARILGAPADDGCSLECPVGALLEGEPDCYDGYVDSYNGGCNSNPYVFSVLDPTGGTMTLCGTSGVYNNYGNRDTDWFQIDLIEQRDITFCCTAEFPLQILVVDGNSGCESTPVIGLGLADECQEACIQMTLAAGTYWLWVGPSSWEDSPCGSDYVMTVDGLCEEGVNCLVSPDSLDFGSIAVGTYLDKDFTIANAGCDTLIGSVSETCLPYSIVSGGGDYTLASGELLTVTVRFSPMTIGCHNCQIAAGIDCEAVECTGTGLPIFASFPCWSWAGGCLKGPNRDVSTIPACIRDDHFDGAFPNGLVVGVSAPGRHKATWTSAEAVQALECGYGLPAALSSDYIDPMSSQLGSIYGEMVALRMTKEFSCKGYFSSRVKCYGDEVVPPEGLKFAGLTVNQLLAVGDQALSGNTSALVPYGNSLLRLQMALALMNQLHEDSGWAAMPPPGLQQFDDDVPEEARDPLPEGISVTSRPNPLESGVTIGLGLPAAGNVSLQVYDVLGRRVVTVASGQMTEGYHDVTWNGADASGTPVASGVYFLRVQVGGRVAVMHKLTKL